MVVDADIINRSLERVAERVGDPAPLVYRRLFERHPEMEALFVRDAAGLVRGQMLMVAIESLLDHLGRGVYGANLIRIERVNHEGLGVPPEVFDAFFTVMMESFRDALGSEWTGETEAAWRALLADLARLPETAD